MTGIDKPDNKSFTIEALIGGREPTSSAISLLQNIACGPPAVGLGHAADWLRPSRDHFSSEEETRCFLSNIPHFRLSSFNKSSPKSRHFDFDVKAVYEKVTTEEQRKDDGGENGDLLNKLHAFSVHNPSIRCGMDRSAEEGLERFDDYRPIIDFGFYNPALLSFGSTAVGAAYSRKWPKIPERQDMELSRRSFQSLSFERIDLCKSITNSVQVTFDNRGISSDGQKNLLIVNHILILNL